MGIMLISDHRLSHFCLWGELNEEAERGQSTYNAWLGVDAKSLLAPITVSLASWGIVIFNVTISESQRRKIRKAGVFSRQRSFRGGYGDANAPWSFPGVDFSYTSCTVPRTSTYSMEQNVCSNLAKKCPPRKVKCKMFSNLPERR